jgi:Fe2+ or Zn2+ uptake regulation protein
MGKALPCDVCKSDHQLRFRRYSESNEHWINCEGCGQIGPVKSSIPEAGEAWNELMQSKSQNVN